MPESPYISVAIFQAVLPIPTSEHQARALMRNIPGLSIKIGRRRYVLRTAALRVAKGLDPLLNGTEAYDYAMQLRPLLRPGVAPEVIDVILRMTEDDRIDPSEIRAELVPFAKDGKAAKRLASHRTGAK
jgi:hypothetical protein